MQYKTVENSILGISISENRIIAAICRVDDKNRIILGGIGISFTANNTRQDINRSLVFAVEMAGINSQNAVISIEPGLSENDIDYYKNEITAAGYKILKTVSEGEAAARYLLDNQFENCIFIYISLFNIEVIEFLDGNIIEKNFISIGDKIEILISNLKNFLNYNYDITEKIDDLIYEIMIGNFAALKKNSKKNHFLNSNELENMMINNSQPIFTELANLFDKMKIDLGNKKIFINGLLTKFITINGVLNYNLTFEEAKVKPETNNIYDTIKYNRAYFPVLGVCCWHAPGKQK